MAATLHQPELAQEPWAAYQQLRMTWPVAHSSAFGGYWVLARYDDVRKASLDWRTFTSGVPGVTAIPVITRRSRPQLPIEIDPPLHSRYRSLMAPSFAPARVEELRPRVRAIAGGLAAAIANRTRSDLIADFAIPFSVQTLAAFTDLPSADAPFWVGWIRRMFDMRDRADGARASAEFGQYIDAMIAARRQHPAQDFLGRLMAQAVNGAGLIDEEIHAYMTVLFGAGFETTADAMGVALHWLLQHPEECRQLAVSADLVPTAVEEFLRVASPILLFGRNATREVELHGRCIPEGDIVALGFGSANRDASVFPDAETCKLDRAPNRHLAFGSGPHLCLGAPIARLELTVMLQTMAPLLGRFRLDGTETWKQRGDRRGIERLPVIAC